MPITNALSPPSGHPGRHPEHCGAVGKDASDHFGLDTQSFASCGGVENEDRFDCYLLNVASKFAGCFA